MIAHQPATSIRAGTEAVAQLRRGAERERADEQRLGRNATPGLDGAVAAHPLEVQRAEDEGREHPGDQERAHDAGDHQRRAAQDAQREDRVGSGARAQEAGEQRGGDGEKPSVRADARP